MLTMLEDLTCTSQELPFSPCMQGRSPGSASGSRQWHCRQQKESTPQQQSHSGKSEPKSLLSTLLCRSSLACSDVPGNRISLASKLPCIVHAPNNMLWHADGRLDCFLQKCAAICTTTALSPCQRRWMSGRWASRSLSCGKGPLHGPSSGTITADAAQMSRDPARSRRSWTGFQNALRERLPSSMEPYLPLERTIAGTRCKRSMS